MKLLDRRGTDRVKVPQRVDTRFRGGMSSEVEIDRRALAADLRHEVEGEVRFDTATRALYATDASNFRQPPIGVVLPKTLEDVVAVHRTCHDHGAPVLPRGCGTSLSGETVNYAVVIDFTKYLDDFDDPDLSDHTVVCRPGAINEKLNEHTGKWGWIFGPDPSTHAYCAIGGNVGNNSCGIHSVQSQFYGHGPRTSDNTHSLEIVTYDGLRTWVGETSDDEYERILAEGGRKAEIYRGLRELTERYGDEIRRRFPPPDRLPRRVSGYNLDELLPENGFNVARALVGTEGTIATTLQARLYLTPAMLKRTLVVVEFDTIFNAGRQVPWVMEHRPIALEALDHRLFELEQQQNMHPSALSELPARDHDSAAWLMVEFGADTKEEADELAQRFVSDALKNDVTEDRINIFDSEQQEQQLWKVREGGLGATAFPAVGEDHWPGWEDSAVPPEVVGDYMEELEGLYRKYGYRGAMYGHVGQGCVHSRISFDLRTPQGLKDYRSFMEEAADLCIGYGGTLSGEHGDGQQRAELLPKQYGDEVVEAFREFKRIWDPEWKMNPGKVVDPYRLDENLKLGADYEPWRPQVAFSYQEDQGDFAHATIRCVGVGKCRQPQGEDVMCPSFMVTRDEMHTTRGRARLLFEMLQGEIVEGGWQSDEVMEALDLCLACKGCTNDCPVNVDMPTYKAEFLHQRWKHRLRPRHAYAFGLIDQVARVASRLPEGVNVLGKTPPFSQALKFAADMTQHRAMPEFAPLTLQRWFEQRGIRNPNGRQVVLFPDTFNNHFHTDVGVAAVEAIEAAGWQVLMPKGHVCCGRPLYDYGFLKLAERYLRRTLEQLRPWYRDGVPIVGLEPSCAAVFKDELTKLLPHDDDAKRLRDGTYHFSEFFREFGIEPPRLDRSALLWGHCHHKATGGIEPERELLAQMGLEVEQCQAGCCGLAGSWGFESSHYDISMQCGEQGLLPKVRELPLDHLVIANGFSCKTQIEQGSTGRRALHVAQVMKMAHDHGPQGMPGPRPESAYYERRPQPSRAVRAARAGAAAGAFATALGVLALGRRLTAGRSGGGWRR